MERRQQIAEIHRSEANMKDNVRKWAEHIMETDELTYALEETRKHRESEDELYASLYTEMTRAARGESSVQRASGQGISVRTMLQARLETSASLDKELHTWAMEANEAMLHERTENAALHTECEALRAELMESEKERLVTLAREEEAKEEVVLLRRTLKRVLDA